MAKIPRKTVIGFLIWNLVVLALWIWCRQGSIVQLEFKVDGRVHTLTRDGERLDSFQVPVEKMVPNGKAGLGLSVHSRAPLRVAPQEISDFRVWDHNSDKLLLSDSFIHDFKDWTMMRGTFNLNPRNRIQADRLSMGATGSDQWDDCTIEMTLYNPTEAYFLFRFQDKKNYGRVKMRFWRELITGFSYYKDGKQSFHRLKSLTESVEDNIRSLMLRFIKVYAVSVSILASFLLLFTVLSLLLRPFAGTTDGSAE